VVKGNQFKGGGQVGYFLQELGGRHGDSSKEEGGRRKKKEVKRIVKEESHSAKERKYAPPPDKRRGEERYLCSIRPRSGKPASKEKGRGKGTRTEGPPPGAVDNSHVRDAARKILFGQGNSEEGRKCQGEKG